MHMKELVVGGVGGGVGGGGGVEAKPLVRD